MALKTLALIFVTALTTKASATDLNSWRDAIQSSGGHPGAVTRTELGGGLAEYRAEISVGPGEFDRIGLHRVIKEISPWQPIAASRGVMLVHGSASNFRTEFAPGLVKPAFGSDAGL